MEVTRKSPKVTIVKVITLNPSKTKEGPVRVVSYIKEEGNDQPCMVIPVEDYGVSTDVSETIGIENEIQESEIVKDENVSENVEVDSEMVPMDYDVSEGQSVESGVTEAVILNSDGTVAYDCETQVMLDMVIAIVPPDVSYRYTTPDGRVNPGQA